MMSRQKVRIGRNVNHDPASWNWRATLPEVSGPVSVLHRFEAPVYDQGDLGACTGYSLVHLLNFPAFGACRKAYTGHRRYLDEKMAKTLYSEGTREDDIGGVWPPEDVGSSALGVCKAAKKRGLITEYRHAFGFDEALRAAALQPVLVGTAWSEDMFWPDKRGFIRPTGPSYDGHEWVLAGVNVDGKYITGLTSWGPKWGPLRGRFRMHFDDFAEVLADKGDCTIPIWRPET